MAILFSIINVNAQEKNGFIKENNNTFFYIDGVIQKGVTKIGDDYYFLGENTGRLVTGWVTSSVNGKVYYSGQDGKLYKGFNTVNGVKYYFSEEDCSMQKGVTKIGEDYYFLGENTGRLITGWVTSSLNGKVYYSGQDGKLKSGLIEMNNTKYYFNENDRSGYTGLKEINSIIYGFKNGILQKGIQEIKGQTHYFDNNTGIIKYGWNQFNGDKYYSNENGIILKGINKIGENTYFLGENTGRLITGWVTSSINSKIYYSASDGILKKGDQTIEGNNYRFNDDYSLLTGWQTINGQTYYFYADGTKAKYISKIAGIRYEFSANGELQHSNIKVIADLSFHNGNIDWNQLWNSGKVDGVILRIGYSAGMDKVFPTYLSEVKRLNIPYSVYHFSTAENINEAQNEANHLISWYNSNSVNPSYGVFYDIESWYNYEDGHSSDSITVSTYDEIIRTYKSVLNDNGISVSLYTGKNYAETRLSDYGRSQIGWIAHYASDCGYTGTYRGWQYTSKGSLPGVPGYVDLSIFYN